MTRFSSWAVPSLAALIAIFTLVPAEVWAHPAVDQEYRGFDGHIVYPNAQAPGRVRVSSSSIDIESAVNSTSSATLFTTTFRNVIASVDVTILQDAGASEPFRIGLWSPLNGTGYFVRFGPAPTHLITAEAIDNGGRGATLVGGDLISEQDVGTYALGKVYRIVVHADRTISRLSLQVLSDGASVGQSSIGPQSSSKLFAPARLSLTASSIGGAGSSEATLSNYDLQLVHERFWAVKVDDQKAQVIAITLAVLALVALLVGARRSWRRLPSGFARIAAGGEAWRRALGSRWVLAASMAGAVVVYLAGNALLFPLGGHPFDMGEEKVYAYVAGAYGPAQLFYLPNVVPLAHFAGGLPYLEAAFPYGPAIAYLFDGIGWLYSLPFAGGGAFSLEGRGLEALIKSANVLFGLGDAALIYLILQRIAVPRRWRLIATGLFLFNPAVWFSMSVWGQTHVISVFFVLAAIWFAESNKVSWAWLALIAACLTRPQMLVFGLVVGIVLVRKFDWRVNVFALSTAVVITYVLLLPLTLATSPSLPVDVLFSNFHIQEAGGNDPAVTTLSQGAYTVWPLVSYLRQGLAGLARLYTESSTSLLGPLTYQRAGQVVTLAALAALVAALARRRREWFESGRYIPVVALGITTFLMLLTGIVSSHFILALPLLILSWRWTGGVPYFFIVIAWSITTLVTMYGDMGITLTVRDYPLLAQGSNAVTRFFIYLYSSDRFITVGTVANTCAVIWLAVLAFRDRGFGAGDGNRHLSQIIGLCLTGMR